MGVPSAEDCILYLWSPAPLIEQALGVLSAWGFTYKSHMVWDKKKMGMGYWFRGQHELLTVSTKGNFSPPPSTMRISSIMKENEQDIVRNLILYET